MAFSTFEILYVIVTGLKKIKSADQVVGVEHCHPEVLQRTADDRSAASDTAGDGDQERALTPRFPENLERHGLAIIHLLGGTLVARFAIAASRLVVDAVDFIDSTVGVIFVGDVVRAGYLEGVQQPIEMVGTKGGVLESDIADGASLGSGDRGQLGGRVVADGRNQRRAKRQTIFDCLRSAIGGRSGPGSFNLHTNFRSDSPVASISKHLKTKRYRLPCVPMLSFL
jgi:hypothetical protein